MSFVEKLHRVFEPRRRALLTARGERQETLDSAELPDFLPETTTIRNADWYIKPLPPALHCRRVEITGPVERKMIINALNAGADSYMADFEDSNTPNWANQIQGQINLMDAVRGTISLEQNGKHYKLNDKVATLLVRPRGLHLDEKHVLVDGQRVSGGIFDFALFFFHNAKEQIARGTGPFFYLPKLESHLEARLWNDIFIMAQDELGIPRGTIKATVLIETILAAFEMEEILYELREHSAGLNAGRWDYIFSCIKKFKSNRDFCLANRSSITMTVPFMRSYALSLVKACHKRGAPAIGGMSALIPIKGDPEANEKALAGVRADKTRDANDGFDGGWVAHPGLVPIAMEEFVKVLGDRPNQWDKQRDDVNFTAADLLNFQPEQPITEAGLRNNINVGIHYLGSWLTGNGCVPIHNLMEDAATAEISRSQVWQWVRSPKGVLDDGRKVTAELVRELIAEELLKVKTSVAAAGEQVETYERAAVIFETMSLAEDYPEFLTLPLYEQLD
ncbi:MAG: malate synthase [Rhodocyclales bacterium]|nr:malate synthase [Rhodocyclales bacterium]